MENTKKYWLINKKDDNTAEIFLYGNIGDWGDVKAGDFVKDLRALEKDYKQISLRVNSNGGSVYDGLAIYNAIKNSSATIEGYIDGIAASMASVVVMGCNKIYMSKVATLMTHKASTGAFGNADDLKQVIEQLDACDEILAGRYAEKVGCTMDEAKSKFLNGKDMFFSAAAALSAKLIDGIYDGVDMDVPKSVNAQRMWEMYNALLEPSLNQNQENLIVII